MVFMSGICTAQPERNSAPISKPRTDLFIVNGFVIVFLLYPVFGKFERES